MADRFKLVEAVAWAAGEKVKQDFGLPSEWNQASWFTNRTNAALGGHCGTAGCIAGKVAIDAGWVPDRASRYSGAVRRQGRYSFADDVAREELELTEQEALRLFDSDNSLEDLLRIAAEILGED